MKKKALPFVLLFLMLISSNAFSQSDDEKLRIHIAPLNLFDPITGVLQVGIQKNLNQRLALSLDHGFEMQAFKYLIVGNGSDRKNYKYSKSKVELKYFINLKNRDSLSSSSPYLSVEGMYFPQTYVKEDEWIYREHVSYRYEYSNIRRTVWVASLKLGNEVRYNKVVIDNYIGIGVRQLSISHHTFGEIEEEYYGPADLNF